MEENKLPTPWMDNDKVKINSIRISQNYELISVATTQGYRIFNLNNYKMVNSVTEANLALGNLSIACVYFGSELVYVMGNPKNEKIHNQLIVFNDEKQEIIGSFGLKEQAMHNFYISQNLAFVFGRDKLIVLSLLTFQVLRIYSDVNANPKLCSYSPNDVIAFTTYTEPTKVYIKFFSEECVSKPGSEVNLNNKKEKHVIKSVYNREINSGFELVQTMCISLSGQRIAMLNVLGNKMHIFNVNSGKLRECVYFGDNVFSVENMSFCFPKENYLLMDRNSDSIHLYKYSHTFSKETTCKCEKFDDGKAMTNSITRKRKPSWINGMINNMMNVVFNNNGENKIERSNSININNDKNIDGYIKYYNRILSFKGIFLCDFFGEKKKVIIIGKNGYIEEYSYKKVTNGNFKIVQKFQWA